MKILKSLNKNFFSIIFVFFLCLNSIAEEKPVDIWNVENNENQIDNSNSTSINEEMNQTEIKTEQDIFKMQNLKKDDQIKLVEDIYSKEVEILGLYDPEDNSLDIDMWSNSDGDQLKNIFSKIRKINLSNDAKDIMEISLLTNSYPPKKNISEKEFHKFKNDWLIKNSNLDLIEEYLVKNQVFDKHVELTRFLLDEHLSSSNIDKSCEILSKNFKPLSDEYLFKFNIYCLIINDKSEDAQLIYDLKKELGFKDSYFENKISQLLGYNSKIDNTISEKTILSFHLAHKVNSEFVFEPNNGTKKIIWKYLNSSNLLESFQEIDISEIKRISTIEKAVNNKNYPEKDLFEIYKNFQFNINQLLNAENSHKSLERIEARALVYQKILLESDPVSKLKFLKILKKLFKEDNLNEAFDVELKKFLQGIDPKEIPDNLTSFYYTNIQINDAEASNKNIKFNNDILHQSKLLNYFNGDYSKSKIEKDVNNFLKKIKKNKKYFFSKKDQIFLESLRSDGVEISKKYDDLYEINESEIPTDIQVMINNNEKGATLLRIAEVIGQDKLERIDEDTIYFIISTLNQLDIDFIRNKILLKVLPLKV